MSDNNNGLNKINEALKRAAEEREKSLFKEPPAQASLVAQSQKLQADLPSEDNLSEKVINIGVDHKIVAYFNPKDPTVEQFRSLRTHIYLHEQGNNLKTVLITSSRNQEGKTLVAVNLSVVIAQDFEKPTLLMDCNLRKPCVDLYMGLKTGRGLSEFLLGTTKLNDVLVNTDVKNLTILPSGQVPLNPAELIGSQKMKDLLAELKSRFDYIILDAPPTIPYADPRILGSFVDGVVIVVRTGVTHREAVTRTEGILKNVGCNILGYVLTGIEYYIPEYIHRHL